MHLVMDVIMAHEIVFSITEESIEDRREEWNKTVMIARSRADFVKALCLFVGLELIDYAHADVQKPPHFDGYFVKVRSKQWLQALGG